MAMVTSTSLGNNTFSQTLSFDNRHNLRDPSFSSYLNKAEENFVLKLADSTQSKDSPTTTSRAHNVHVGREKDIDDEEIGVFGAEKYFQGEMEESLRKPIKDYSPWYQQEKDSSHVRSTQSSPNYMVSANICPVKEKNVLGTPSVCSESSLNSQSALLHRIPRNRARGSMNKGSNVKSFLASFGCNCNDKSSVEVDDQLAETRGHGWEMTKPPLATVNFVPKAKSTSSCTWAEDEVNRNLKREECFSFPVLDSKPGIQAVKSQLLGEKENNPLSFEKQLTMLTNWNVVISREEETEIPSNGMHNDAESDASSDLFEIDSFSTSGNSVFARQASDGMSSCVTPPNCYAPSEASIEWSVVTASAADFSNFSDYESVNGKSKNLDSMVRDVKTGKSCKDMQKKRPRILSGCKSQKAVSVVENGYRTSGGHGHGHNKVTSCGHEQHELRLSDITPETRFRAEATKLAEHHSFDMCSLPRSHSRHLLYGR